MFYGNDLQSVEELLLSVLACVPMPYHFEYLMVEFTEDEGKLKTMTVRILYFLILVLFVLWCYRFIALILHSVFTLTIKHDSFGPPKVSFYHGVE